MEELLTVHNSRTHRSKQEEIFVGEHKTYTMDAFRWQAQPGDKPREFFAGTKVTCLNKLGMREEGLTLFVYCGGKLTSGSKLIIVLFSLFPMRFEIPCLKNPDDCRTVYPIQKCSVSIWQLVSKMCPVLEWIRERHPDRVLLPAAVPDTASDMRALRSGTPNKAVASAVPSATNEHQLPFPCKISPCSKSFPTAKGCNTHMKSHERSKFTPYPLVKDSKGQGGHGAKGGNVVSAEGGKKNRRHADGGKGTRDKGAGDGCKGHGSKRSRTRGRSPSVPRPEKKGKMENEAVRDAAREAARDRGAARDADREAARQAARQAAREDARDVDREAARDADMRRFLQLQSSLQQPLLQLLHTSISAHAAPSLCSAPNLFESAAQVQLKKEYCQTIANYPALCDLTWEDFYAMPAEEWALEAQKIPLSLGHKKVLLRLHTKN
jgi:hypothetical protein